MSEKPPRRKIPANRRIRQPHTSGSPSSSAHRLHRRLVVLRSSSSKKPLKLIKRCNSEPTLLPNGLSIGGGCAGSDEHWSMTPSGDAGALSRYRDRTDISSSSPELFIPLSPQNFEGYNKDGKVVINVTVEGSPGPIRAMVKLGSSVDETIRLVADKYNAEGRSPQLDQEAITSFQLHNSHFSLQCLDKSDMIGDIGSRSFYLRKSIGDKEDVCSSDFPIAPEIVALRENDPPPPMPLIHFPDFMSQNFKNFVRKTRKLWKILGCIGG